MPDSRAPRVPQRVQFCRAPDGVRIAYAVHGSGPPLLISTCWLSHLQFDWESPVWRHFLTDLGKIATVIRFDERGHGLSDWDVSDHSLEARIGDLEAVADAAGFPRFALMAMAQGGPVAISYAVRHPERVSRLLFYGSYACGSAGMSDEDREMEDAFGQADQGGVGAAGLDLPTGLHLTDDPGRDRGADALARRSAARIGVGQHARRRADQQRLQADAEPSLPSLRLPTLILHSIGDRMNSFEYGRHLASSIEDARLVALDSENHIVLEDEPAWQVFVDEVRRFLVPDADLAHAPARVEEVLSVREIDVLRLAAAGHDNEAIATMLHLSMRTVERHLQNIYAKLGLQGRSARAAAVARLLAPA